MPELEPSTSPTAAQHVVDRAAPRRESGVHLRVDFPETKTTTRVPVQIAHRDAETGKPVAGVSEPAGMNGTPGTPGRHVPWDRRTMPTPPVSGS